MRHIVATLACLTSLGMPFAVQAQSADYYRGTLVNSEAPDKPVKFEFAVFQRGNASDASVVGWLQFAAPLTWSGPAGVLRREPDSVLYLASLSMAGDTILWRSGTRTGTLSGFYRFIGGENSGQHGTFQLEPQPRTSATTLLAGCIFLGLTAYLVMCIIVVNSCDAWWSWRESSPAVAPEKNSIDGWLLLFLTGQLALLTYQIMMATDLGEIFRGTWMLGIATPHLRPTLIIGTASQFLQIIGIIAGLVLFVRRSPTTPPYWVGFFIVMAVAAIYGAAADTWITPTFRVLFGPGKTTIADDIHKQMTLGVGMIAYAIICASYWTRSERVRVLFSPAKQVARGVGGAPAGPSRVSVAPTR
jgi:Protein of unknown function (DUF2569)